MLDLEDELGELTRALRRLDLALKAYGSEGQDPAESVRQLESVYVELALLGGTARCAQEKVRLELSAPGNAGNRPQL